MLKLNNLYLLLINLVNIQTNWQLGFNFTKYKYLLVYLLVIKKYSWRKQVKNLFIPFNKKTPITLMGVSRLKGKIISFKLMYKFRRFPRIKYYYKIKKKKKLVFLIKKFKFKKYFNILRYVNFFSTIPNLRTINTTFCLTNRVFMNTKVIKNITQRYLFKQTKNHLLHNYYKKLLQKTIKMSKIGQAANSLLNKIKLKKIKFLNFHKKLTWKIRGSRYAHWHLTRQGKVTKWRYQQLFKKLAIGRFKRIGYILPILFFIHTLKLSFSWRQLEIIINYQLWCINGIYGEFFQMQKGDIIETSYGPGLFINQKLFFYLNKRIVYRLKRWSYHVYLNSKVKSKTIYKKIPKSVNSIGLSSKFYGKMLISHKGLGLGVYIGGVDKSWTHSLENYYNTSIIKLNNWRYKF